jgi:predicted transcriptional regulator
MTPSKLTRREREIMDALFELGDQATAEDIRLRLIDPPSYSAVRAMLAKLEAKGVIRHRAEGLRYVYTPTTARSVARKSALRRLLKIFFEGSPGKAVTALLDQEQWSEEELDEMSRQIERVKKQRRPRC